MDEYITQNERTEIKMRRRNKEDELKDSTLIVRIDCRNCTAKFDGCHRRCPQAAAVSTEAGKSVTGELLKRGRRARVHKDVNVTFGKFMSLVGELECRMQNTECGVQHEV